MISSCRRRVEAAQETGHFVERLDGGREANALDLALGQVGQAFQAEGEMNAALVAGQGMNLIHNDGMHPPEHLPRLGAGQQQVERFRGGDQNVGRLAHHSLALPRRGIAGANGDANFREGEVHIMRHPPDAGQRRPQVAAYIVVKGLQGRDIDNAHAERGRFSLWKGG